MSQSARYDQLLSLAEQVRSRCSLQPQVAILLGTGLGGVAGQIDAAATIPYEELDGMPQSTADHHAGDLILGHLGKVAVVAFSGRLHCYEGHSAQDVVLPVQLAKQLGASTLIMGSAVGGMNPQYALSDLVLIEDHINFMGVNPLVGPNDERIGPRWPDMIEPYNLGLADLARQRALAAGIDLHRGVYAAVLGPNLETKAEYRMLRQLGGDVVGMSTVPETIAAVHCGIRVLAFGIVTDLCLPDALEPADINRIIAAAGAGEPVLGSLIADVIAHLPDIA